MTNPYIDRLDDSGAQTYLNSRPSYPNEVISVIKNRLSKHHGFKAVDIGAGSGQMTRMLAESGFETVAVEPSAAMRNTLAAQPWVDEYQVQIVDGYAEATTLADNSQDLITWAQSFHWFDQERATAEAARILRPGGVAAAIWNQLDVRSPWVHRLSRIMRSGDVLLRQAPPSLEQNLRDPKLVILDWEMTQTPKEVIELGRTRTSYLNSNEAGKQRLQNNLHWYLYEHLQFYEDEPIVIPYRTLIWTVEK